MKNTVSFAQGSIPAPKTRTSVPKRDCKALPCLCKRVLSAVKTLFLGRAGWTLANVADLQLALSPDADDSSSLANIAEQEGGWALIAKYGNHPHPGRPGEAKPVVQRFERPDADRIVANFKTGWGRIKRALVGLPVYDGHPDAKGYENIFRDKTVHGTFADLRADDVGLWGQPVLTTAGSRLVEDGKDRLSPLWDCAPVGNTADGKPIVAPHKLKSVGLVERGNIPGPSLMNAAQNFAMKQYIIALLAALGRPLANAASATDDQLAAAVNEATPVATALANASTELSTLKPRVTTLESENATLKTEKVTLGNSVTTVTGERDTLKTNLAAERRERATLLANAAMTEGRITAAERDTTITELCNAADFKVAAEALAAKTKKLSTASKTLQLGNSAAANLESPGSQLIALANARMRDTGETYTDAFIAVQADPKNAAILAAMKQPEAAK